MVVGKESINSIMSGIENTGGVKQHNNKKKLKQRFDIIKKLGQGTFGKVQLGINKETGQEVAIKIIKKSKIESEADLIRIRREIQIMSSVQHPNIIHIYEVFENREKMVLVMEYAAGGELYDYLSERKVLQEDEARRIFRQIATACYYCHKHKICHRDLKLENILLDENNNAKIADFGLSNVFDDQRLLSTFCGSPLYASPEIVKGTPYHGPEVDCWSLGVLLYTLVYGAMPFDGSNFKRLVKQISQGDYFEPTTPSPASPLIRDMLTVNPKTRADIEKICMHWWVNESYDDNCLDISEDLANQTPVRLDLLLSLAPPPPQLESDKLVVTGEATEDAAKQDAAGCTRSQSVGSLMELTHPAERRIKDLINDDKATPKRKLETTVSTDRANLDKGLKRKDKIIKENTVADITVHGTIQEDDNSEALPLNKSSTQTLSREMDVDQTEIDVDPSLQGAVCSEIIEEAAAKKKPAKLKKNLTQSLSTKMLEGINEIPSQENVANDVDKENIEQVAQLNNNAKQQIETKEDTTQETKTSAAPPKKKTVKKKVFGDKNENVSSDVAQPKPEENKDEETPNKPIERRRSRIFEAAEKFQNMMSPSSQEIKPAAVIEKPKKIVIPGVSVDGFKKEFERKASLTSTTPPKVKGAASKKHIIETQPSIEKEEEQPVIKKGDKSPNEEVVPPGTERKEKVRNAVNIISSALDMDGTRKSKSRPCMMRKPPVPFGASGRSASGNIGMISSPLSPPLGPKPFVKTQFETQPKQVQDQPEPEEENQTSSAEITLKSATLPRRKTTKAEIQLNYPVPKPATMEFKTEVAHNVGAPTPKLSTQRSEVVVPVTGPPTLNFRATSLEPDQLAKGSPKERIIPISFEKPEVNKEVSSPLQSPPAKPPKPRLFQTASQRSNSLSRQSTQDSDTETVASTGEPIRKSPREYIIPIAVEGGGYVTPRAGSLEPSETASTTSNMTNLSRSKFGRPKRMNSRLSDRDSEDESSPFSSLHRHSSFGKDSDTEDSRGLHMHRLRSTRPKRSNLEHTDSVSSGEEDDDDGFEILTAENLFSTLLSRVRDLTQRLNVEDNGGRPGFPSSRLLSHFDHGTNFWNLHNRMEPLSRHSPLSRAFSRERERNPDNSATPWRRSVSRDLATDIESVFKDTNSRPRGDKNNTTPKNENLNLADLDLKKLKLSDEDALALSYLTPGLSKRIQKQLLSQLAPSEARKLHRTLSSCNSADNPYETTKETPKFLRNKSMDRLSTTLPRRVSSSSVNNGHNNIIPENEQVKDTNKSFLPIKGKIVRPYSDFSVRSASIEYEPSYRRRVTAPRYCNNHSPDSSFSESISQNDSSSYNTTNNNNNNSVSELSTTSYSSISRPSNKYSEPQNINNNNNKYLMTPTKSYDNYDINNKTDVKKPSTSRRISRFLRPDFFDTPRKEDNALIKEKKEREMETQKVLKEIRDKRKSRLNMKRERSKSRELENSTKETNELLNNVSNNIKNLETNVNNNNNNNNVLHDYVNVVVNETNNNSDSTAQNVIPDYVNVPKQETVVIKKDKPSKIARPKSYPTENIETAVIKVPSPEKESKISRLKKGCFIRQSSKEKDKTIKDDKNETNEEEKSHHRNSLLQSIEKKLEKFRSNNNKDNTEDVTRKSGVEHAIKKLREQSLPRTPQCTESGLIKRAVSVEDLSNLSGNKPLQASRKSVTKILGLFKKYEEQEKQKKNDKLLKKKKSEESKATISKTKKESVILNNDNKEKETSAVVPNLENNNNQTELIKKERPRSLLLDRMRNFQQYNGAKSDTTVVLNNDKEEPKNKSKLPVNSFRRSLNLDNVVLPADPPKYYNQQRQNLKLDLSKIHKPQIEIIEPSTSRQENRNSLTTTDESSPAFLSPGDENEISCDSWSVCSDYHTQDLASPVSPNGHLLYSGDENESVIDRIRRKSFYTRFNEKKRARKPSLTRNYKDLDLYKDSKSPTNNTDYGSLDRKCYDYRTPRKSSYSLQQEPKKENKAYTRSSSLLNDYVNVPNRYQTYSSKIGRPATSLYSDTEDSNTLDDLLSAAKSRKYSSHLQPSRLGRMSVSPSSEQYLVDRPPSSIVSSHISSPDPI